MTRFEWNSLRVGDAVLVHESAAVATALAPGRVVQVARHRSTNDVGIVVGARIRWLSRFSVHADPRDATVPCWQCTALAAATA